jgi:hypothetical protein
VIPVSKGTWFMPGVRDEIGAGPGDGRAVAGMPAESLFGSVKRKLAERAPNRWLQM